MIAVDVAGSGSLDDRWLLWLTGLPASGKSTLATALRARLDGRPVVLDYDEILRLLVQNPTYLPDERDYVYRCIARLGCLLARRGSDVIIAATGERKLYRDWARTRWSRTFEVWVHCPLDTCRSRDPKGLYARVDAGLITRLPGVGVPYEIPAEPSVVVDTSTTTVETCVAHIVATCGLVNRR